MSIKKLVLVLGLLCGMNSGLNAVKPEHQARVEELCQKIWELQGFIEFNEKKLEQKFTLYFNARKFSHLWKSSHRYYEEEFKRIQESIKIFIEEIIKLSQEKLSYFEDQDRKDKQSTEIFISSCQRQLKRCLDRITGQEKFIRVLRWAEFLGLL
jgi:type IV secretory pathway VirB4 component